MKRLVACIVAVGICVQPASAQDAQGDADAPSLMERGAQQFLEGLLQEMEPAIEGMRDFMDQMGPALLDLLEEIKDWSAYEPPEMLDNGDIIIRRKPEEPKPRDRDAEPLRPDHKPMPQIEL